MTEIGFALMAYATLTNDLNVPEKLNCCSVVSSDVVSVVSSERSYNFSNWLCAFCCKLLFECSLTSNF